MSTLSERINMAMLDAGISQSDLAVACKIKSPSVNDWLSGKTKSLKASTATRAAAALGVSVEWLSEGRGKMRQGDIANFTPAQDVRDYVPLISMVQAGAFCEAMDNLAVGDSVEMIPAMYPKKRHTFALEVQGDSMLPTFPPGMRLIVEPDMEYRSGDFVIAKNGGDATFKQIVKDGGVWYLKPLNAQFPTLALGESHVIGVVRNAVITFR